MAKIVMPFSPREAKEVFKESKIYDFRKFAPTKEISTIYVYVTDPIMKIIGEVTVDDILIDEPYKVWLKMKDKIYLDPKDYLSFYNDSSQAVVYKLGNRVLYDQEKEIQDFGLKYAPAMLSYVK